MKAFIIEYSGCEFGGVEHIAFQLREDAEKYKAECEGNPNSVVDYYEVLEVDLI